MAESNRTTILTVIIIAILVIVFGLWFISMRNSLVKLDESINASWSEIDNQLQRRSDLIPNLVATVKGYAQQEERIFTQIAEARSKLAGSRTVQEKTQAYNEMESALSRLLVVVENYPNLKSDKNFIRLQDELAGTENRITVARKRYDDSVRRYNTRIRTFPASSIARRQGFEKREYFEIEESAKDVPKVDFDS
jgi:LemA protein